MGSEQTDELADLVERLIAENQVAFSFLPTEAEQPELTVSIREGDESDFDEYGEAYEPGTMFEVGPPLPATPLIETRLQFNTMHQAGDAVLTRRAAMLGVPWNDA